MTAITGTQAQRRPLVRVVDHALLAKPQLAMLYNALCPDTPVPADPLMYSPLVRRIDRVLRERSLAVVDHVPHRALGQHITILPHRLHVVPSHTLPPPVPSRSATRWRDDLRISVTISRNPKTPTTASHARWLHLAASETIGEFIARCRAAELPTTHCRGDIIHAWERGWLSVHDPVTDRVIDPRDPQGELPHLMATEGRHSAGYSPELGARDLGYMDRTDWEK